MNKETKQALACAAQLRQVLTDLIEKIEFVNLPVRELGETGRPMESAIRGIKELLLDKGLFERIYPLEPFEGETARDACRRICGIWIAHDVFDRKE